MSDDAREGLLNRLSVAFYHEDLDPNEDHPAEDILSQSLYSEEQRWFLYGFCTDETNPELASSILLCLCRLPSMHLANWEEALVSQAMASSDMEIREAALQLAESWGGDHMQVLIEAYQTAPV